jgi:lysophospholipid acyltransferase (LPLAT)-like uncharacterized protein
MKIRNRFLTRLLAWLAVRLMRLLFATCRRKDFAETPGMNPYVSNDIDRHLYCIWHDQVVMVLFAGRPVEFAGLVSKHQDGSILSDAMEIIGVKPVRGSSSRGGARALRELMHTAKDRHVAITPDGPRGPRHELKAGIVYLASQSGRKIVPVAMTCKRMWKIRGNWTDMMLPKPFTTLYAVGLRPLHVPPDLDRDGIERFTQLLQAEMDRAERLVEDAAAGRTVDFETERVADQKLAA